MDGFINNIWTGRAGLAKTYWGYGFLGGLIWGVVLSLLPQGQPITIAAVLVFCAYLLAVNVGVWRAASSYAGASTWAALGKVASGVGIFIAVATLALVFGALSSGRPVPEAPPSTSAPHANEDGPWKQYQSPGNPFSDPNHGSASAQPPSSATSDAEWWKKGATQVN